MNQLVRAFGCGIASLLLLVGCAASETPTSQPLRYAKLLRMTEQTNHTRVEIVDPWDTLQVMRQFLLVERTTPTADVVKLQARHPQATVLRTPLRRILSQSTVHAALALRMGAARSLAGLCDTAFVVDEKLKQLRLPDFGHGDQPNVERILAAEVEACLMAPFEHHSYEALERANVPIIDCADYLETTPLGRAEWMRFYGRLFGKTELADSLFEVEAQRYEALADSVQQRAQKVSADSKIVGDSSKIVGDSSENVVDASQNVREIADKLPTPPRVWLDLPRQSTWYAPGGRSYLAALIADAGGDYPLRTNTDAGSVPLGLERAWQYGATADVWIIKGGDEIPTNYTALTQLAAVYAQFPAVRSHRVWTCNTMQTLYYSRTPFAPVELLREWATMLGTLPQSSAHSLRYFHPLSR